MYMYSLTFFDIAVFSYTHLYLCQSYCDCMYMYSVHKCADNYYVNFLSIS